MEAGRGHDRLRYAYEESRADRGSGLDHHAVLVLTKHAGLSDHDIQWLAAFEDEKSAERFRAWLRERGLTPRSVWHAGREFVTWESKEGRLRSAFQSHMRSRCEASPRTGAAPC